MRVRRGLRVWSVVLLFLVLMMPGIGLPPAVIAAEPAPMSRSVYVPETGFWVDAIFAEYWQRNGGLMTFGYPVTRVFYQDGLHRQYFERAIFEHHEQNAGTRWEVQLVRLGAVNTIERQRAGEPAFTYRGPDPAKDTGGSYFQETGHALSATFREYWEAHGGIQTFGYPLSDEFMEVSPEDGVLRPVQYFERARFEYHAEFEGTPFEVLLGHLGREALAKRDVPDLAVTPQQPTVTDRDGGPLGPLPVGSPKLFGCGFNYAFWSDVEHDQTNGYYLDLAKASGCEWLRVQFTWRDLEPQRGANLEDRIWPYGRILQLANERGLKVLVDISHPPEWARPEDPIVPADPQAFASLMSRLAERFQGQVAAWQIWNEPNLMFENNKKVDPYGYFLLLKASYPVIKAADPQALVLTAGLAPTSLMYDDWALDDDWYLEALLSLNGGEAAQYFDALGVHAYGAGNSPDTYYPGNLADTPGWNLAPEFYFRHIEQAHTLLMNAGFGDKPIWITEMGWTIGKTSDVYGYGAWITPDLQAEYLRRGLEIIRTEWQWVDNVFIWHLNMAAVDSTMRPGFSVTDVNGQPLPGYHAIRETITGWKTAAAQ